MESGLRDLTPSSTPPLSPVCPTLDTFSPTIRVRGPSWSDRGRRYGLCGPASPGRLRAAAGARHRRTSSLSPGSRPAGSRRGITASRRADLLLRLERFAREELALHKLTLRQVREGKISLGAHRIGMFGAQSVSPTGKSLLSISLRQGAFALSLVHGSKTRHGVKSNVVLGT